MVNANPRRRGIVHRHQHAIWLDAVGPFFVNGLIAVVGRLCATHAGSDEDAGRVAIVTFEQGAGIDNGLGRGNQGELGDTVQHAQSRCSKMGGSVERHRCDHAAQQARVELLR